MLEFGGALSGEHGDGMVRGPFTERCSARCSTRRSGRSSAHSIRGLFNPGKIVDTPPLTANLRYGAGYQTPDPPALFDYAEFGGMGRAVEMCSGLGVCRKTLDGTMCPSYMATREEKHSTRGRANTLRLAMAGRLGDNGFLDHDVHDVLDLCLECRACKAECPVGVDVARFKSEFLAAYWQRHGLPFRVRAIGHARRLSEVGSRFAPLSNIVAQSAIGRWVNEQLLGIDRRRTPPPFARESFAQWFAKRSQSALPQSATRNPQSVVLFNDTFTNYNHPDIGMAAAKVLAAAGRTTRLIDHGCCGRPLISQGLLDERAPRRRRRPTRSSTPPAAVNPSSFWAQLPLGRARGRPGAAARRGAASGEHRGRACVLFEDYVEQEWQAGRIDLSLRQGPSKVLLHGHCHQKAMGLMPSARALAARIPSCSVADLDAGCCGMAGSFGYAKEHYRCRA